MLTSDTVLLIHITQKFLPLCQLTAVKPQMKLLIPRPVLIVAMFLKEAHRYVVELFA